MRGFEFGVRISVQDSGLRVQESRFRSMTEAFVISKVYRQGLGIGFGVQGVT